MSKRSVMKVKIEVSFTLPPGRTPADAVKHIQLVLSELNPPPAALQVRLLSKELTYLN